MGSWTRLRPSCLDRKTYEEAEKGGEVLIRVRLKLSPFIYKSVDLIRVPSLSHWSKHRKMLLISVCEAEGRIMSTLVGQIQQLQAISQSKR